MCFDLGAISMVKSLKKIEKKLWAFEFYEKLWKLWKNSDASLKEDEDISEQTIEK